MISKISFENGAERATIDLTRVSFRPFTQGDWNTFLDCSSLVPLIAEFENFILVIDGEFLSVFDEFFVTEPVLMYNMVKKESVYYDEVSFS